MSELIVINYSKIEAYNGAFEKQNKLVKDNPFVSITDSKSYQEAKKARTALKTGRTELQIGEKTIASKIQEFRGVIKRRTLKLIRITKNAEEIQQAEITRYETEKQRLKEEEERKETARLEGLRNDLSELCEKKETSIRVATIQTINSVILDIESLESNFQDLQNEFLLWKSSLLFDARKKKVNLEEVERLRVQKLEQEKKEKELAEEKAKFVKEKKEAEAKRQKEAKEQEQKNNVNNALELLNYRDTAIINMQTSIDANSIGALLENSIDNDFGVFGDEVKKRYKILKEKLEKRKADLHEKEEFARFEKKRKEIHRQKLGKKRQKQLKTIEIVKSIDDCLSFDETAYFEYFQKEQKIYFEVLEQNKIKKAKEEQEAEKQKRITEAEEKRQLELQKPDAEKMNDLIDDLEALKAKPSFESKLYKETFEDVKAVFDEIIHFITYSK